MRILRIRPILISLFILPTFACAQPTTNDFDKVCGYFIELSKQKDLRQMTQAQRNDFITARIADTLDPNSDAKAAWDAVSHAVPAQRYELFKSSTESVLNRDWQCPAMEQLAPSTGVFE